MIISRQHSVTIQFSIVQHTVGCPVQCKKRKTAAHSNFGKSTNRMQTLYNEVGRPGRPERLHQYGRN